MSLDRIACRIPSIPQVSMTRLKFGAFILLTNVILCMCPATAWAQKQAVKPSYPTPQHPQKYVPGRLLVRFRSGRWEERRVGKECRSRRARHASEEKNDTNTVWILRTTQY